MVSKEAVEGLMLQHFPTCPLCSADKGYEVSGWAKTYVQCNSCGAKWMSTDFPKLKQIENMFLWELPRDGRGAPFLNKEKSIEFWLNVDLESPEFQPTPRCPKCDVQLTGWICSSCKSTVSLSTQSCPKCGSKREPVIACAKCKTPLAFTQDNRLVIADKEKLK